ncbi:acylase [Flavihumibacter sp. R14]|nr:acylase [Flavihumibacter soli]
MLTDLCIKGRAVLSCTCLLLLFIFVTTRAQTPDGQVAETEILWDNYGVPHIYAKSAEEMYYSFGWSQMHSHGNLILQLYAQSRGRAAEYLGKTFIESDKQIRLFKIPEQAAKNYALQRPEYKSYLDAFVNGLNDYAKAHPGEIGEAFQRILPVKATDVLGHGTRIMALEFLAVNDIAVSKRLTTPGSNSIAIGPTRSQSKKTMLVSNPHLPWADFFTFYEAHLNSPGFNAYGVSLVGFPVLNIAFNENLGWTHTVNTIDASDRYELMLRDDGYELDGKTETFEEKTDEIKVRQDDGTMQSENVTFRYSRHGPVVGQMNGKAFAIRIAGLENPFMAEQFHQMAKAGSFAEFESSLKMMQLAMFNVVYADKAGNIMYLFNGNVPVRAEGDWKFWNSTVNGTSSRLIWNKTHPYSDLPKVYNPATGFVQNANDPPWTSTFPIALDPKNFPAYMAPQRMGFRPQRAVNMLKADQSITFEELVSYKVNTEMEAAHRFLDDLLAAVDQYPDSLSLKAAAVLKAWDKSTNADSRGAILFEQWFGKLNGISVAKQWSLAEPVSTPDGLSNPKRAVELLVQASQEVMKKYGSLDIPYGEINRFRIGHIDLPGNGGTDDLGVFRTMYFRPDTDHKNRAVGGETYVAITEFGKKVKASVLLSYGNSSQPGTKHAGDQLQLLSERKFRQALLEKEEVLKHLEEKELINMTVGKNKAALPASGH